MNDRLFEPAEPDDGLKPWQRRDPPKIEPNEETIEQDAGKEEG